MLFQKLQRRLRGYMLLLQQDFHFRTSVQCSSGRALKLPFIIAPMFSDTITEVQPSPMEKMQEIPGILHRAVSEQIIIRLQKVPSLFREIFMQELKMIREVPSL